jgi:hypothetical protein
MSGVAVEVLAGNSANRTSANGLLNLLVEIKDSNKLTEAIRENIKDNRDFMKITSDLIQQVKKTVPPPLFNLGLIACALIHELDADVSEQEFQFVSDDETKLKTPSSDDMKKLKESAELIKKANPESQKPLLVKTLKVFYHILKGDPETETEMSDLLTSVSGLKSTFSKLGEQFTGKYSTSQVLNPKLAMNFLRRPYRKETYRTVTGKIDGSKNSNGTSSRTKKSGWGSSLFGSKKSNGTSTGTKKSSWGSSLFGSKKKPNENPNNTGIEMTEMRRGSNHKTSVKEGNVETSEVQDEQEQGNLRLSVSEPGPPRINAMNNTARETEPVTSEEVANAFRRFNTGTLVSRPNGTGNGGPRANVTGNGGPRTNVTGNGGPRTNVTGNGGPRTNGTGNGGPRTNVTGNGGPRTNGTGNGGPKTNGTGNGGPKTNGTGNGGPKTNGTGNGGPKTNGTGNGEPRTNGTGNGGPKTNGTGNGGPKTNGTGNGEPRTNGTGNGGPKTNGTGNGGPKTNGTGNGEPRTNGTGNGGPRTKRSNPPPPPPRRRITSVPRPISTEESKESEPPR